jgi:periodic tryptophan protein 1
LGSLSDQEDYEIKESDCVLLVAQNVKGMNGVEGPLEDDDDEGMNEDIEQDGDDQEEHVLEMQVFDSVEQNLYVHHDFPLPDLALCLEWLSFDPRGADYGKGSFVAVGTIEPTIEIWNLDVIDVLEPTLVLGGLDEEEKVITGSHEGPVTSLSYVERHESWILSSSADSTLKVWDLNSGDCIYTLNHHKDKVQSGKWNPIEPFIAASVGSDKLVSIFDVRTKKDGLVHRSSRDLELLRWNPHNSAILSVVAEEGYVHFYDVRKLGADPVITFQPHPEGDSVVLSFNLLAENIFATASFDHSVAIWDLSAGSSPSLLARRTMEIGAILSVEYYPSSKYLVAAGGSEGLIGIWDTSENSDVERRLS